MFRILLFLLLLFPLWGIMPLAQKRGLCTCVSAQKMLPVEVLPGLVDSIHGKITELHPFAFMPEGVKALEAARTQVQATVKEASHEKDSVSLLAFTKLASPLQEATNCGHLILAPFYDSTTYKAVREKVFPMVLTKVEDGRHLLQRGLRTSTDSLPTATQITAINGQKVGPMIESMRYFAGLNDQGNVAATRAAIARYPALYYQNFYGLQDSLEIEIVDSLGRAGTRILYPTHHPYINPKKTKTDINKTLQFKLSDDAKTGIITIRSFKTMEFYNGNYYRFLRNTFDSIKTLGLDQLVIDIRNNTGGSSGRINYLYAFIAEQPFQFCSRATLTGPTQAVAGENASVTQLRLAGAVSKRERKIQRSLTKFIKPRKKKERYTGRVVVLINEISFSASGMFARFVQGSGRGKLVGATAGAAASTTFGGNSKTRKPIYLGPDNALELRVNTLGLTLPFPIAGNVTPDVAVPITAQGLKTGADEQLEAALKTLKAMAR